MRRPILLTALAVALAGAIVALVVTGRRDYSAREEPDVTGGQEIPGGDESTSLIDVDASRIRRIDVHIPEGAGVDESFSLERHGNSFQTVSPTEVPLEAQALDTFVSRLTRVHADRTIDDSPEDAAQYGLDPPRRSIALHLDDGTIRTLFIGNDAPDGTSTYLAVESTPSVYTIETLAAGPLFMALDDLWTGESVSQVEGADIQRIVVRRDGVTAVEVASRPELVAAERFELRISNLYVVAPVESPVPADVYRIYDFVTRFGNLGRERIIAAETEDPSRYGLDTPAWELLLEDKNGKLDIVIGDRTDSRVYLLHRGQSPVYVIDAAILDLLDVGPYELASHFIAMVDIGRIESLEMAWADENHVFALRGNGNVGATHGNDPEGRSGTGDTDADTTYLIDGVRVEERLFKNFYVSLMALEADAFRPVDDTPLRAEADLTMIYRYADDATPPFEIRFVGYDGDFYAVSRNGRSRMLANRSQVLNLIDSTKRFLETVASEG